MCPTSPSFSFPLSTRPRSQKSRICPLPVPVVASMHVHVGYIEWDRWRFCFPVHVQLRPDSIIAPQSLACWGGGSRGSQHFSFRPGLPSAHCQHQPGGWGTRADLFQSPPSCSHLGVFSWISFSLFGLCLRRPNFHRECVILRGQNTHAWTSWSIIVYFHPGNALLQPHACVCKLKNWAIQLWFLCVPLFATHISETHPKKCKPWDWLEMLTNVENSWLGVMNRQEQALPFPHIPVMPAPLHRSSIPENTHWVITSRKKPLLVFPQAHLKRTE